MSDNYSLKLADILPFAGAAWRNGKLIGVPWCPKCNKPVTTFALSCQTQTQQCLDYADSKRIGNSKVEIVVTCHDRVYSIAVPARWLIDGLPDMSRHKYPSVSVRSSYAYAVGEYLYPNPNNF